MQKFILFTSACILTSGTALAEMPYPKKPYSAKLEVTANGKTVPADMYISDSKIRMEMVVDEGPAAGRDAVFIADRKTGKAFTLADMDGRKMAIKMDFNQAMNQINYSTQELGPSLGTKRIGFRKCTNYKTMAGTTCLTKDYVVLEAKDAESHMIVKELNMGPQAPSLFEVPSGYQVLDMGAMLGGFGGSSGASGSIGGVDLGNLGGLGSPMEIGKALSEGENANNANNEGFNNVMQSLGLPTESADTAAANTTFGGMLNGMIKDEVKGTNAEGFFNGSFQQSKEFIEGTQMKNKIVDDLENGVDPMSALMKNNGVSDSELADFRRQGKEIEALNAPGGFIDQQQNRFDPTTMENLNAEQKRIEDLNAEAGRLLGSGNLTEEANDRINKEAKDIEKQFLGLLKGK